MPLSALIRAKKEEILADWEEIVRSLGSARALPHPALIDHVPELLDWLTARIDSEGGEDDDFPHERALEHALGRIQAGYDLAEVLSEYMVLRDCIHEAWDRDGRAQVTPREIRRLNQALDDAITYTAVFFVRTQLTREDRAHPVALAPVH